MIQHSNMTAITHHLPTHKLRISAFIKDWGAQIQNSLNLSVVGLENHLTGQRIHHVISKLWVQTAITTDYISNIYSSINQVFHVELSIKTKLL